MIANARALLMMMMSVMIVFVLFLLVGDPMPSELAAIGGHSRQRLAGENATDSFAEWYGARRPWRRNSYAVQNTEFRRKGSILQKRFHQSEKEQPLRTPRVGPLAAKLQICQARQFRHRHTLVLQVS